MKIEITDYKEHQKNSLLPFVDLLIVDVGAQLKGCTLHESNGKRWIGLPAKPYDKGDGTQGWARMIDFPEREDYLAFQNAALAALQVFREVRPGGDTQQPADFPF